MEHREVDKKAQYAKGDKVEHRVFGTGEILSVDTDKGAYLIQFEQMDTPREISFKVKLGAGLS